MKTRVLVLSALIVLIALAILATNPARRVVNLPSSKALIDPVPGNPQPMGAFPVNIAVSPDKKYAAILEAGYGTIETELRQSIAVLDFDSGEITRYADPRLGKNARQSFFIGIAWSSDGRHIYAPMGSITDPTGTKPLGKMEKPDSVHLGNGIAVYAFDAGKIAPEWFIKISPQPIAEGKKRGAIHKEAPAGTLAPYPAGIAVVKRDGGGDELLVADNLSDDVLLIDAKSGDVIHRFDVSTGEYVPSAYPYAVVVNKEGTAAWVSLWNSPKIAALDLERGAVSGWIQVSSATGAASAHPTALAVLNESALAVTLSNEDRVAIIDAGVNKVAGYLSTKLPNQIAGGAFPNAIAINSDSTRLYVANASSDAVAVFDISHIKLCMECNSRGVLMPKALAPIAFLPTEWYPTAVAVRGDELLVATGKGKGTGANDVPRKMGDPGYRQGYTYIPTLLQGSLARVSLKEVEPRMKELTKEVLDSNLMNGRAGVLPFKGGRNPIKHVIYVIKENRTYDQIFGDLGVGNGDPTLTMYGEDITPNQHALARRFGVLDNFHDSGEVSGDGHVWSTAAITSDYTEKTWQIAYRGWERTYDFEGTVGNDFPLQLGIPDVNEPGTGYLWTNLARHKKTYRHYGEFVATRWCDQPDDWQTPVEGTPLAKPMNCDEQPIRLGDPLPAYAGGGPSPYPWDIPVIGENVPTKRELVGHFDPHYPDFRMEFPDQLRLDEFLTEFRPWVEKRTKSKRDEMPQFILLRFPNDHTGGTKPGLATPEAAIADNDLAVGRLVEAVSNSAYWDDTAIMILEDDAQDGADHVDAHRSIALVISKYAPGSKSQPFVDSHFYTTVNMIHTMEVLLGLPPMNNNDAQAAIMAPLFSGAGTQAAYKADYRNRDNGLIYKMNPKNGPGAGESSRMDFRHADRVDTALLNAILWRERMGPKPMPTPKHTAVPQRAPASKDDDD